MDSRASSSSQWNFPPWGYPQRPEDATAQWNAMMPGTGNNEKSHSEQGRPFLQVNGSAIHNPPKERGERPRRVTLEWDKYRRTLQRMYMNEDMPLPQLKEKMRQEHSFEATTQQYKAKFNSWGWKKNVPSNIAHWMVQKAEKRKREARKDTIFQYRGTVWTTEKAISSAQRKKQQGNDSIMDMATPGGMFVITPGPFTATSPASGEMRGGAHTTATPRSNIERAIIGNEVLDCNRSGLETRLARVSEEYDPGNGVALRSLLQTKESQLGNDFNALFDNAIGHYRNGRFEHARDLLGHSFEKHCCQFAPSHEDGCKVGFAIASFYHERSDLDEASWLLETIHDAHAHRWDFGNPHAQQHILQIVRLLNSWGKGVEALAFLARTEETTLECPSGYAQTDICRPSNAHPLTRGNYLGSLADLINADATTTAVNHALDVAQSHVAAADEAVEELLLAIIRRYTMTTESICEFYSQVLRSRTMLLELYSSLDVANGHETDFDEAKSVFDYVLSEYAWSPDPDSIGNQEVIERLLGLANAFLKSGRHDSVTKSLFRRTTEKAEAVSEECSEFEIRVNIFIGQAYHYSKGWCDASEWFEHALASALGRFELTDGIITALEKALKSQFFSYFNDNGRPYKTIFGRSGTCFRQDRCVFPLTTDPSS